MKPVANKEERKAHRAWLERGETGRGRIDWVGRDLSGARDHGVPLRRARLVRCDLGRAIIQLSLMREIYVEASNCDGSGLVSDDASHSRWLRTSFRDANLGGSRFEQATLEDCDLSRANLNRTTLTDSSVVGCTFVDARFTDTTLDRGRLERCDFRGARFDVQWRDGQVAHAIATTFVDCDFGGATFERYTLSQCRFERCRFHDVAGPAILPAPSTAVDCDPPDWPAIAARIAAPRA